MRSLIVDIASILFRVAAVQKQKQYDPLEAQDLVGLCMHISLMSIKKWYEKFQPDQIVFAFEGGNNWRKTYTAKHVNKISIQYKANRVFDPTMQHFYELINSLKDTIKAHTSIKCLCVPTLEADDLIAGYCQQVANDEHQVFILSGDKDFIQLLKNPNVKLVDPDTGKFRNQPGSKKYEENLDYWLFLKCVRGDMGDYVPSAFPRVRETKIKLAYENDLDKVNFMKERWDQELPPGSIKMKDVEYILPDSFLNTKYEIGDVLPDGSKKINVVGELFEHNKVLVSLFDQPVEIRTLLETEIPIQLNDFSKYSHFHFLSFCGKYKLHKIGEEAIKFNDMFSCNQLYLKNGEKNRKVDENINSLLDIDEPKFNKIQTSIDKEMSKADKLKAAMDNIRAQKNKQKDLLAY